MFREASERSSILRGSFQLEAKRADNKKKGGDKREGARKKNSLMRRRKSCLIPAREDDLYRPSFQCVRGAPEEAHC